MNRSKSILIALPVHVFIIVLAMIGIQAFNGMDYFEIGFIIFVNIYGAIIALTLVQKIKYTYILGVVLIVSLFYMNDVNVDKTIYVRDANDLAQIDKYPTSTFVFMDDIDMSNFEGGNFDNYISNFGGVILGEGHVIYNVERALFEQLDEAYITDLRIHSGMYSDTTPLIAMNSSNTHFNNINLKVTSQSPLVLFSQDDIFSDIYVDININSFYIDNYGVLAKEMKIKEMSFPVQNVMIQGVYISPNSFSPIADVITIQNEEDFLIDFSEVVVDVEIEALNYHGITRKFNIYNDVEVYNENSIYKYSSLSTNSLDFEGAYSELTTHGGTLHLVEYSNAYIIEVVILTSFDFFIDFEINLTGDNQYHRVSNSCLTNLTGTYVDYENSKYTYSSYQGFVTNGVITTYGRYITYDDSLYSLVLTIGDVERVIELY